MIERVITKGHRDMCPSGGHGKITIGNLGDIKEAMMKV
jgi:hypothetical protein